MLFYRIEVLDDLHQMLKEHRGWIDMGSADEQKPVKPGTVEAWARSEENSIGGWYGLKKGYRGLVAMYIPRLWNTSGLQSLCIYQREIK